MRTASLSMVATLAAALLMTFSPGASAASCTGRPGSSAVEQYCEAIPSAGGSQQSKQDSDRSTKRRAVSRSTAEGLRKSGDDGAAVLQLTGGDTPTAPARKRPAHRKAKAKAEAPARVQPAPRPVAADAAPSGNVLDAVKTSATSGPAAGGALIWILLATTFAVGAAAWISRRRRPD